MRVHFKKMNHMQRILHQYIIFFSLLVLAGPIFASIDQFHKVITLSWGLAKSNVSQQHKMFTLPDNSQQDYNGNYQHNNLFLFGGSIGLEFPLSSQLNLQSLLSYYQTDTATVKGTLTQGIDRQSSDQYQYQYDIYSRQVLVEGKLLWNFDKVVLPYLSLGIGAAFNTASDYKDSSECTNLTITPSFGNHTQTSLALSLGIGIDFNLTSNTRLGAGYRYLYLGDSKLTNPMMDDVPLHETLKNRLQLHELIVQFTYLIS